jgi:hypothetical protein
MVVTKVSGEFKNILTTLAKKHLAFTEESPNYADDVKAMHDAIEGTGDEREESAIIRILANKTSPQIEALKVRSSLHSFRLSAARPSTQSYMCMKTLVI